MLAVKNLTIRNFLSIGNVSQGVVFDKQDLVLVLGENLDLGGNDSRNGCGKTSMINALSYALYGNALTKIKQDNLINKTNGKNMLVTVEFEKDGNTYRIERGRRPKVFKFIVNGDDITDGKDTDEAQGDMRLTQRYIEDDVLCLSHNMFKNIIALNTYNEPFLSMGANDQREIIEQLLGITKLSEKADLLKNHVRSTKDEIKEEDFRIKAMQESNAQIDSNIKSTKVKSAGWEKKHTRLINDTTSAIAALTDIEIDEEIANHTILQDIEKKKSSDRGYARELSSHKNELKKYIAALAKLKGRSDQLKIAQCPTCSQDIDRDVHEQIKEGVIQQIADTEASIIEREGMIAETEEKRIALDIPSKIPSVFYNSIDEAYNHKSTLATLHQTLEKETTEENPFLGQIEMLEESRRNVSYDTMNSLVDRRDHQEFLLKLLTSKDSFIRKKIIDQNVYYLNKRLAFYLEKIGLPHVVQFMSNLEVSITEYGRDLDFDNLSRGERTRLILSLSWAFRDVYESLNDKINLLFIDELLDSGLDTNGVESSLSELKRMTREYDRSIYLVSHRDELVGRVDNIMKVIKEGGFTLFDNS